MMYERLLAEDVQTPELKIEFNRNKKVKRVEKPIPDKKEQLAEKVWSRMQEKAAFDYFHIA